MGATIDTIRRYWHEQRPRVVWGTLLGVLCLAFLVGAWLIYDALASPPVPDIRTAPGSEVARFIGHERGWRRMSVPQRKQWLIDLIRNRGEGPRREELVREFRRLSKLEKRVFVDGFIEVVKPELLADARAFAKTPPKQRSSFLRQRLAAYDGLAMGLRGGGVGQDLASPFGAALPSRSEDWTSLAIQKTSAPERAEMKPYIEQLTAYAKMLRQQARNNKSKGGPAPTP